MFNLKSMLAAALVLATAGAGLAYVNNPVIQKRQETMQLIGANMKILAPMAQGKTAFDTTAAQAAFAKIAEKATAVPNVFETEADDPESKAKPEIWLAWEDFTSKAAALKAAAEAGTGVDTPEALGAAVGKLGAACKACHSVYKM